MVQPVTARPPAVDFDLHDQSIANRIHEVYRDLRSDGSLQWSEHHGGYWVATDYDSVHAIAQAPEQFTSDGALIPDTTGGKALVPQMLQDPEHRLYRTLLKDWFTPRRIASFEPSIRTLTTQLLEPLASPVDLASALALPLPIEMILRVVGVQDHSMDAIRDGARYIVDRGGQDPSGAGDMFEAAVGFIKDAIMAPLRDNPGDDLLSFLIGKQDEVEPLNDDMIAIIGFSIIAAGFDTTYKTMSSSLAYFAANPEVQAQARQAPPIAVVEEMLRLFAPVSPARRAQADSVVGGRNVRAGDTILLAYPAANRDPAHFEEPDSVRLDRNNNQHMTFGTGIHKCLGMHLARLELRVAFEEVFRAFDEFHIDPSCEPTFLQSQVWGAVTVPVEFRRSSV
jgi:cytochrome P450